MTWNEESGASPVYDLGEEEDESDDTSNGEAPGSSLDKAEKRGIPNCSSVCCYVSALMQVLASLGLKIFSLPLHSTTCDIQGVDCMRCAVEDMMQQLTLTQAVVTEVNPERLVNLIVTRIFNSITQEEDVSELFVQLVKQVPELAEQFIFRFRGSLSCRTCAKISFDIPVTDFMLVVPLQPTLKGSLDIFFRKEMHCVRLCPVSDCKGTHAKKQQTLEITPSQFLVILVKKPAGPIVPNLGRGAFETTLDMAEYLHRDTEEEEEEEEDDEQQQQRPQMQQRLQQEPQQKPKQQQQQLASALLNLLGIIVHIPSERNKNRGHYVSYLPACNGDGWLCCNDSTVTRHSWVEVLCNTAYMLFYGHGPNGAQLHGPQVVDSRILTQQHQQAKASSLHKDESTAVLQVSPSGSPRSLQTLPELAVQVQVLSGAGDHAVPSSDCQPSLEGKFDVEITDPDIKIPNSPRYSKHLSKASRFTPHKKGISAQKPGTGSHSNQGLRVAAADKKASAAAAAAQAKAAAAAAAQAAAAAASKAAVEAASFEAAVASNAGGIQPAATATAATVGAAMEEGFDMGHEIGVSDDINRQGDGLADMGFPSATATTSPASASVATNVQGYANSTLPGTHTDDIDGATQAVQGTATPKPNELQQQRSLDMSVSQSHVLTQPTSATPLIPPPSVTPLLTTVSGSFTAALPTSLPLAVPSTAIPSIPTTTSTLQALPAPVLERVKFLDRAMLAGILPAAVDAGVDFNAAAPSNINVSTSNGISSSSATPPLAATSPSSSAPVASVATLGPITKVSWMSRHISNMTHNAASATLTTPPMYMAPPSNRFAPLPLSGIAAPASIFPNFSGSFSQNAPPFNAGNPIPPMYSAPLGNSSAPPRPSDISAISSTVTVSPFNIGLSGNALPSNTSTPIPSVYAASPGNFFAPPPASSVAATTLTVTPSNSIFSGSALPLNASYTPPPMSAAAVGNIPANPPPSTNNTPAATFPPSTSSHSSDNNNGPD